MKLFLLAIFSLPLFAAPAFAGCEGFEYEMAALEKAVAARQSAAPVTASFTQTFSSREELLQWAQNSTLGGGRIDDHDFQGRKFIFAYRGYTSGIKSSDIAVYIHSGDQWKLVKTHPLIMGQWVEARRQDDAFIFRPEGGGEVIMTLALSDLNGF